MNITDDFSDWPLLLDGFLANGGKALMGTSTHTATAHGVLYEALDAPEFIESGSAKLPALDFVFGCLTTGEPAIRCEQSGRVWVGSFDGLIALALAEGVGL